MCNKKYKYIYLDVHRVMEICIDSLIENDAEYRSVPEGSRIAIETDYYLQIRVSPSNVPIDYNLDWIK